MTREEAKRHMNFLVRSYQNLLDNDVRTGDAIGEGYEGVWEAKQSLADAYKTMIDAINMSIEALDVLDKVKEDVTELPRYAARFADGSFGIQIERDKVFEIIDKYKTEGSEDE